MIGHPVVRVSGPARHSIAGTVDDVALGGAFDVKTIPENKTCSKCREVKAAGNFYRNRTARDGLYSRRKPCHSEQTAAWAAANREKVNADHAAWRKTNLDRAREHGRNGQRRYLGTPNGRQKNRARCKLNNAVAAGKLSRPEHCSVCAASCKPHGHHEDYAKPLSVEWLCTSCHALRHMGVTK